jgi:RNA polymerase sigma-70 factor (ECF subfamily)
MAEIHISIGSTVAAVTRDEADAFEAHRAALFGVAYRMLGTKVDAEDVLQEAWLRWQRVDPAAVDHPRAYLIRLVANEAIDHLRRVRARREEYLGPWLPEPIVGAPPESLAGESASVGLLVVLETLTPDERAVFVLHEAFGFGHQEIADMLGRTERAVRQLAYRARRHVRDQRPRQPLDPHEHRELTERFVAAAVRGDLAGLLRVLNPDAVLRADSDGQRETPREPLVGAPAIAGWFRTAVPFLPKDLRVYVLPVNGDAGALVCDGDAPFFAVALGCAAGRVVEIDLVANPTKLPASARDVSGSASVLPI